VLEELLGSVLGAALVAVGQWFWRSRAGRDLNDREQAIVNWFDTQGLATHPDLQIPLQPGLGEEQASAWLRSHETQGILYEMIVLRIAGAPPTEVDHARDNLRYASLDFFPESMEHQAIQLAEAVFYGVDRKLIELVGQLESKDRTMASQLRTAASHGRIAALLRTIARHSESQASLTPADRASRSLAALKRGSRTTINASRLWAWWSGCCGPAKRWSSSTGWMSLSTRGAAGA
jgi:hypothetical protein